LDELKEVLPKKEDKIKFELLIGENVQRALEPIKVHIVNDSYLELKTKSQCLQYTKSRVSSKINIKNL